MWEDQYKNIQKLIKGKIEFLDRKEKSIDLTKPENYNKAILNSIKKEREFINELLAFLMTTEDMIKNLSASNKHLEISNTFYFMKLEQYEAELNGRYLKEVTG